MSPDLATAGQDSKGLQALLPGGAWSGSENNLFYNLLLHGVATYVHI